MTALLTALVMASVTVQASLLEACGACPSDCPMHAAHGAAPQIQPEAAKRPHCHGDRPLDHGGQVQLRRPPCKTSFTLAGSLLPPFDLLAAGDWAVVLPAAGAARADGAALLCRYPTPETPPPILSV